MNLQSLHVFLILSLVYQICGKLIFVIVDGIYVIRSVHSVMYIAQCKNDSVRLTGGPNEFEGRVELCVDGNWGQVCAMGWTGDDADVVCHQLGYNDGCELVATHLRMFVYFMITMLKQL